MNRCTAKLSTLVFLSVATSRTPWEPCAWSIIRTWYFLYGNKKMGMSLCNWNASIIIIKKKVHLVSRLFAEWPDWCSSRVQCSCCGFLRPARRKPEPLRAQFLIRAKANQTSRSEDRAALLLRRHRHHPHPQAEVEGHLPLQKRCWSRVKRRCLWPSAVTWSATGARRSRWSRHCMKKAAWASLSSIASATASATPSTSRATCVERKEPSSRARSASPGASPPWPTRCPAQTSSRPPARSACSASNSAAASPSTWTEVNKCYFGGKNFKPQRLMR